MAAAAVAAATEVRVGCRGRDFGCRGTQPCTAAEAARGSGGRGIQKLCPVPTCRIFCPLAAHAGPLPVPPTAPFDVPADSQAIWCGVRGSLGALFSAHQRRLAVKQDVQPPQARARSVPVPPRPWPAPRSHFVTHTRQMCCQVGRVRGQLPGPRPLEL